MDAVARRPQPSTLLAADALRGGLTSAEMRYLVWGHVPAAQPDAVAADPIVRKAVVLVQPFAATCEPSATIKDELSVNQRDAIASVDTIAGAPIAVSCEDDPYYCPTIVGAVAIGWLRAGVSGAADASGAPADPVAYGLLGLGDAGAADAGPSVPCGSVTCAPDEECLRCGDGPGASQCGRIAELACCNGRPEAFNLAVEDPSCHPDEYPPSAAATPTCVATDAGVVVTTSTPNATLFYTCDGTIPTFTSSVVAGPIRDCALVTVFAAATGYEDSPPTVCPFSASADAGADAGDGG